jgi:hypothetical protein
MFSQWTGHCTTCEIADTDCSFRAIFVAIDYDTLENQSNWQKEVQHSILTRLRWIDIHHTKRSAMAGWDPRVQTLYGFLTEVHDFSGPILRGVTDDIVRARASESAYWYTPGQRMWQEIGNMGADMMLHVAQSKDQTYASAIHATYAADPTFFNFPSTYVRNPSPAHFVHI